MIARGLVIKMIWLGLALRIVIACWNGLAGPSFGANADAATYHRHAVNFARDTAPPDTNFAAYTYPYLLGLVYRVTGESVLVGSLLSCVAWLASALVLLAMMQLLRVPVMVQAAGMAVYAVLPSSVIWTSVTLREPYQLLCVNLAMYSALRVILVRDARYWAGLIAAAIMAAYLHAVVAAFALFVIALTILVLLWRAPLTPAVRLAILAVTAAAVVALVVTLFGAVFRYDLKDGPLSAVENYLEKGMYPARSNYRISATIGSWLGLLLFVPLSILQYLFEPMPWNINAWIDAGYVAENIVRAIMIGAMIAALLRLRGEQRLQVAVMFTAYLCLESLWAIGTLNWGTAARHHLPAAGILVAGAAAYASASSLPARVAA